MKQSSRSIITYVLMMLIFGTLIYFAIEKATDS